MTNTDDSLKRLYNEAVEFDERRPASSVRAAALAHAQMVVDARTASTDAARDEQMVVAANSPNWKVALVASVLLVPLVGVLVLRNPDYSPIGEQVADASKAQSESAPQAAAAGATPHVAPAQQVVQANTEVTRANGAVQQDRNRTERSAASVDQAKPAVSSDIASAPMAVQEPSNESGSSTLAGHAVASATATATSLAVEASRASAQPSAKRATVSRAIQGESSDKLAAFFQAVAAGDITDMERSMARGATVNSRNAAGKTALIVAVQASQAAMVARLLALGAKPDETDWDGLTALQHAQQLGNSRIVALLLPVAN
jgi:hypothetical protein